MTEAKRPRVAIVDYGVGNLFSVQSACEAVDLDASLETEPSAILAADAVIVPGVGAFGEAMAMLHRLRLVAPLREVAARGTPLVGICLGLQLFMTESREFGTHEGLGIFEGTVVRFPPPRLGNRPLKVPQVGWNRILAPTGGPTSGAAVRPWTVWPLDGIPVGASMYFVHSYIVQPAESSIICTITTYGDVTFCSSVHRENIFACQFHPERSGPLGIMIYRNIAAHIARVHSTGV